ncbi:hypothetical protein [Methylobacterium sp. 77]|uniref:hypothetical protein n=1 Tax=Methylobacterium sp. 77 TaxID=1101192 RepID=UPI000363EB24|nr:hypothetical protein [Methylobacterium sp. 77]
MPHDDLTAHTRRVLWTIWDPIGVAALGAPEDEYDDYVPGIVALVLDTHADGRIITDHLTRIVRDEMCLDASITAAQGTARALLGLREAYRRNSAGFVDQILSRDGRYCVWIFCREERVFHYEYATWCEYTDVNGTCSWWSGPECGRSGLFETATAAESEARASLWWLRDRDRA